MKFIIIKYYKLNLNLNIIHSHQIIKIIVGGVDTTRNEVAKGKHLEDVIGSIDKTNGSVDTGLKEGVKLSTLTISAHIYNLGNKGDQIKGMEM